MAGCGWCSGNAIGGTRCGVGRGRTVAKKVTGGGKPCWFSGFRDLWWGWGYRPQRVRDLLTRDGCERAASFKAAIDQYLPRAQHVLDRFHIIRWFETSPGIMPALATNPPNQPTISSNAYRTRILL